MRHRLLIPARSILLGWAALFALTYLVERPLLSWTAPLLGASWLPTAQLTLQCVALFATGWVIGWLRGRFITVLVFAVMLAIWNFSLVPAIDLPWLFRLTIDAFGNPRFLESLITSAATHALLFGSLFVGASLNRAPAGHSETTGSRALGNIDL
jgi:hypothetical protein